MMLDLRYSGNASRHLIGLLDINQPLPGEFALANIVPSNHVTVANTPYLNQIRPYRGYGPIAIETPIFNGNYNALQATFAGRIGRRSRFGLNYTWSRSLTNSLNDSSAAPQNTYDPKAEYGLATFDRRQIFTAHFVYDLPFFLNQRNWRGRFLGGYELSGIVTAASGIPLTAIANTEADPAGQGVLDNNAPEVTRPDQIGDPNQDAPHSYPLWVNLSEHFKNVPAGQYHPGNEHVGVIRGPGYQVWNIDLFKNISLPHETRLQIRAEAFNIWNHVNWTTVGLAVGGSTSGTITGARDPRKLQFGAKYVF